MVLREIGWEGSLPCRRDSSYSEWGKIAGFPNTSIKENREFLDYMSTAAARC
jgi:hypothetical protein